MRLGAGVVFLLATTLVLAGAAGAATQYRVSAVTASARLTFDSGDETSFVRGSSDLQIRGRPGARVMLGPSGGRVATKLRLRRAEQVRLGSRSDVTQPYLEDACTKRRKLTGRGGFVLRKVAPGRLQIRWAFPHAVTSFCPGPAARVTSSRASRMVATLPVARIGAKRLVLRVSGRAPLGPFTIAGKAGTGTYTWRASITLVRA